MSNPTKKINFPRQKISFRGIGLKIPRKFGAIVSSDLKEVLRVSTSWNVWVEFRVSGAADGWHWEIGVYDFQFCPVEGLTRSLNNILKTMRPKVGFRESFRIINSLVKSESTLD